MNSHCATVRQSRPSGFSLVELLVVIAVISLLAMLMVPAFNSINRGRFLEQAGAEVINSLAQARQHAMTMGVRTRWDLIDIGAGGGTNFRIHRVMAFSGGQWEPVTRFSALPNTVELDSRSSRTSLITNAVSDPSAFTYNGENFSGRSRVSVDFHPDGMTTITSAVPPAPFLTFRPSGSDAGSDSANWFSVVINPVTGRAEGYRP